MLVKYEINMLKRFDGYGFVSFLQGRAEFRVDFASQKFTD